MQGKDKTYTLYVSLRTAICYSALPISKLGMLSQRAKILSDKPGFINQDFCAKPFQNKMQDPNQKCYA